MKFSRTYLISGILFLAGLAGIFLVSCQNRHHDDMIIVTRVPVSASVLRDGSTLPDYNGSALVAVHADGSGQPEVLTPDFFSAASPHVAYDGKHILFSARKSKDDSWQIWEMDLQNKKSRQITHCQGNCYTPYYLPGNKLVFSREMPDTGTGTFLTLFTLTLDGKMLRQITYHPSRDLISTILDDGRVLMCSRQVFPDTGDAKCLALRPNGTKMELFYQKEKGARTGLRMTETPDHQIWFAERSPTGKWNIDKIRYNRSLHSRTVCTGNIPGDFYSVLPYDSVRFIVSYKKPESNHVELVSYSPRDKKIQKTLLSDKAYNYLDPVVARPYKRPRNLPDELMCSYPTGLLMSQNINFTADGVLPDNKKAVSVEVLGMDKSLGIVPVEKDGSVYLKIPANMPFRIQTLDRENKVVLGPSDWQWLRPFERRGCVGCHEDPELSPENIVPLAINTWPVVIPVDTSGKANKAETFKVSNMK